MDCLLGNKAAREIWCHWIWISALFTVDNSASLLDCSFRYTVNVWRSHWRMTRLHIISHYEVFCFLAVKQSPRFGASLSWRISRYMKASATLEGCRFSKCKHCGTKDLMLISSHLSNASLAIHIKTPTLCLRRWPFCQTTKHHSCAFLSLC